MYQVRFPSSNSKNSKWGGLVSMLWKSPAMQGWIVVIFFQGLLRIWILGFHGKQWTVLSKPFGQSFSIRFNPDLLCEGPLVILAISHVFKTLGAHCVSATVLRAKEPKMDKNIFKEPALKSEDQVFQYNMIRGMWYKIQWHPKRGMGSTLDRKICLRKDTQKRMYLSLGIEEQVGLGDSRQRDHHVQTHWDVE